LGLRPSFDLWSKNLGQARTSGKAAALKGSFNGEA